MSIADPEQLEALAARLDGRAEEVRADYRRFRTRVGEVAWQSEGASDYRDHCEQLCGDLEGNAQELNDAADDLRKHAQSVRDTFGWIDDMVGDLRDRAEEAWDETKGAFEWGKDQASGAVDKVIGWL